MRIFPHELVLAARTCRRLAHTFRANRLAYLIEASERLGMCFGSFVSLDLKEFHDSGGLFLGFLPL